MFLLQSQEVKKKLGNDSISFLICTLISDFERDRKVVLQTQIFFWISNQKKTNKQFCRITILRPEKKSYYAEPLFSNLKKGGFKSYCQSIIFWVSNQKKKIRFCRTTPLAPSKSSVQIKRL